MIRVRDLHKSFGGQGVLRGLTLDVATGEIMVVIGRSGGGKSVLLKHMIGLLRPDSGSILVDDTDITRVGGSGLDTMYITTAAGPGDGAGGLFAVQPGVAGLPTSPYRG